MKQTLSSLHTVKFGTEQKEKFSNSLDIQSKYLVWLNHTFEFIAHYAKDLGIWGDGDRIEINRLKGDPLNFGAYVTDIVTNNGFATNIQGVEHALLYWIQVLQNRLWRNRFPMKQHHPLTNTAAQIILAASHRVKVDEALVRNAEDFISIFKAHKMKQNVMNRLDIPHVVDPLQEMTLDEFAEKMKIDITPITQFELPGIQFIDPLNITDMKVSIVGDIESITPEMVDEISDFVERIAGEVAASQLRSLMGDGLDALHTTGIRHLLNDATVERGSKKIDDSDLERLARLSQHLGGQAIYEDGELIGFMMPPPEAWNDGQRGLMIGEMRRLGFEEVSIQKLLGTTPEDTDIRELETNTITLDQYQKATNLTWRQDLSWDEAVMNAALGLGEVGEVLNELKKYKFHTWSDLYDNYNAASAKIGDELGDALYYIARMADLFGWTLGEVARHNRRKLHERHQKRTSAGIEPPIQFDDTQELKDIIRGDGNLEAGRTYVVTESINIPEEKIQEAEERERKAKRRYRYNRNGR